MPAMEAALSELNQALDAVHSSISSMSMTALSSAGREQSNILDLATAEFKQHGEELLSILSQIDDHLNALATSISTIDLADVLLASVQHETEQIEQHADAVTQIFASMRDELTNKTEEEVRAWAAHSAETLTGDVGEHIDNLDRLSRETLEGIKSAFQNTLHEVYKSVTERVKERCASVANTTVQAAVDRLVKELADTLIITELGAEITSLISPYLSEIVVLLRLLDAIKEGLRVLRMGH
jgi:DNA anti-recombination protein RmuC